MELQESIHQYYEQRYQGRSSRRNLGRVRSNLKEMTVEPDSRILDVGCGLGETGLYLASKGAQPLAMDISFQATQTAAQLNAYALAFQANAERLPFPNLALDGATFMGTLEHFVNPDSALAEIRRVLKPDAQICFVVPNSEFFLFRFLGGTEQPFEEPRTYEGWHELFESHGLQICKVHRDVGPDIMAGGLLRGAVRRLILVFFNLLPIRQTYQFVFTCSKGSR